MDIETVKKGFKLMEDGMRILGGGPLDFYVRKLTECYDLLISRYAPFKIGERVILTKTPEIGSVDRWGWLGSKHFLIKGAVGSVTFVEADGDGFRFSVVFDDDSWIDHHGVKQPTKEKGHFGFREDYLVASKS